MPLEMEDCLSDTAAHTHTPAPNNNPSSEASRVSTHTIRACRLSAGDPLCAQPSAEKRAERVEVVF